MGIWGRGGVSLKALPPFPWWPEERKGQGGFCSKRLASFSGIQGQCENPRLGGRFLAFAASPVRTGWPVLCLPSWSERSIHQLASLQAGKCS